MSETELRTMIQTQANAIVRAATRGNAEERNRDAALVMVEAADQIQVLARKLYGQPDGRARV
jgi:hypothetical protein